MAHEEVSLLWYTALDETSKGSIKVSNTGSWITGVRGDTPSLGEFHVKLFNQSGKILILLLGFDYGNCGFRFREP